MLSELPLILILDENSRKNSGISVPNILSFGVLIRSSINEVHKDECKDRSVVILEGYMHRQNGFNDVKLFKELYGIECIYIGTDERFLEQMRSIARVYSMDYTDLSYATLETVYSGNPSRVKALSVSSRSKLSDISHKILSDDSEGADNKLLARSYLNLVNEFIDVQRELSEVKEKLVTSEGIIHIKDMHLSILHMELANIFNEALVQNQYSKQMNFAYRGDIYEKVSIDDFVSPPRIIYFKEYTDFLFLDSFIETISQAIKSHELISFKVLRLLDNRESMKAVTLPSYYKIFTGKYDLKSLYDNDFIAMTDGYVSILQSLLTNQSRLGLLIIVDSKSHNDTVLRGTYLKYNLVRNPKNIRKFDLDSEMCITNFTNSSMSWDHMDSYDEFDYSDRFLFLSSREVIRKIEAEFTSFY